MAAERMIDQRLLDTQRAFDSVAAAYDGPLGNNELVQRMRAQLWQTVLALVPEGGRLLDLGCGTGIDAAFFARRGFEVVAIDWSPEMIARTRARAAQIGLVDRIRAISLGIHELEQLEAGAFDAISSDLGPLNCVPDLRAVSRTCARLLNDGGSLVVSVMGRVCPWEFAYYALRGDWKRARLRGAQGNVPVNLNQQTVWTRYYRPREFYRQFEGEFQLSCCRALALFMPPPYLMRIYERWRLLFRPIAWLDDRLGSLPVAREAGDHFLMVLKKK